MQCRPHAGDTAHSPAEGVVEEVDLRWRVFAVFSGSEKRDQSELCRAWPPNDRRAMYDMPDTMYLVVPQDSSFGLHCSR